MLCTQPLTSLTSSVLPFTPKAFHPAVLLFLKHARHYSTWGTWHSSYLPPWMFFPEILSPIFPLLSPSKWVLLPSYFVCFSLSPLTYHITNRCIKNIVCCVSKHLEQCLAHNQLNENEVKPWPLRTLPLLCVWSRRQAAVGSTVNTGEGWGGGEMVKLGHSTEKFGGEERKENR